MPGVLGLIWQGEVDIFIGDLTITYERSLAVEFTFFTLSDSEIFLTHAPGKLNEALALVRPFRWEVWPVIIVTVALSGILLFVLQKVRLGWHSVKLSELCDSVWIITTIFLRQSLVTKVHGDRARLTVILLYLVATYVIGDMYSANLTSLLTRPAREKPISTLEQLNDAMTNKNFKLLVARRSSSHGVLENGTGLYQIVWNKMKNQNQYLLNTVEEGIEQVKHFKTVALLGGRETFFYNAKRYGL
uniref:Ionotropic receptor 1 n=1 Tax=Cyrtorhinus lividipennis TaxID=1032904 RepID=A0A346TI24_9HEMI|nr:ionotropic receptor 1 [Cyrtorhinus lividipennis]